MKASTRALVRFSGPTLYDGLTLAILTRLASILTILE